MLRPSSALFATAALVAVCDAVVLKGKTCMKDLKLKKIVYVNLDDFTERRDFQERELAKTGVPYERWPAQRPSMKEARDIFKDGKEAKDSMYWWWNKHVDDPETRRSKFRGSAGCLKSHVDAMKHIAAEGASEEEGLYLLLEDDFAPGPNISEALAEHMKDKRVPCHFDLARLDAKGRCKRPKVLPGEQCTACAGAHAMLFTQKSARRLAKFYDDWPGELDCQLRRLHKYGLEHIILNFGFGKFSSEKKHSGIRPDDQVLNAPTEDED